MGAAGSVVNPDFFGSYLGMRNEYIDMSEFTCRITDEGIYDPEEYEKAYQWIHAELQGKGLEPAGSGSTRRSTRTGGSSSPR